MTYQNPQYGGPVDKANRVLEHMLKSKYPDKGRERSNRAALIREQAQGTRRKCITAPRHARFAYSGPEGGDPVRAYVCIECGAAASEPEIKDRGWEFDTIPDYIIMEIFDLDLERQAGANAKFFGGFGAFPRAEHGTP